MQPTTGPTEHYNRSKRSLAVFAAILARGCQSDCDSLWESAQSRTASSRFVAGHGNELTPDGGEPLGSISAGRWGWGRRRPASELKYVGSGALQVWVRRRVVMSRPAPEPDVCYAQTDAR
jgi:hypothetical protein